MKKLILFIAVGLVGVTTYAQTQHGLVFSNQRSEVLYILTCELPNSFLVDGVCLSQPLTVTIHLDTKKLTSDEIITLLNTGEGQLEKFFPYRLNNGFLERTIIIGATNFDYLKENLKSPIKVEYAELLITETKVIIK